MSQLVICCAGKFPKPVKAVDEESTVRCASGAFGLIREEIWKNVGGEVVRYNLAFIQHLLCRVDNGRVLGYDNAHGRHERHWMGSVESTDYRSYKEIFAVFMREVNELRRVG